MTEVRSRVFAFLILLGSLFTLTSTPAHAVPSYARQTGAPCSQCHITSFGPALTPFGMKFKLNGYVWGDKKTIPVAGMLVASYNNTQSGQQPESAPHYKANDNFTIDQISLFVGGRIYGNLGMFGQGTFDGVAKRMGWDNLDIRYADTAKLGDKDLTYGISLNNNPSVTDLWNTAPAWSFPYMSSALAPAPGAAPLLEGGLEMQVLGLNAYGMFNDWVYLEGGAYRTVSFRWQKTLGQVDNTDPMVNGESPLAGPAPYWRATVQHKFGSNYASAGLMGMSARLIPGGDASAGTDHLTDYGYDATWQYNDGGPNAFNANFIYIHENEHWGASYALGGTDQPSNQLNTLRFNGGWVYDQTYSLSGGPFSIHGGTDATLYGDSALTGSPNSRGYIAQAEYIPFGKMGSWMAPFANVRLALQYTYYTEFDGAAQNYDANGRSAHDNNTVYAFVWLAM
jgi:hypothetical protein